MNRLEFVVARYNEDVAWTDSLPGRVTIYNKGNALTRPSTRLPNKGRESHTYLYHIVSHYEFLAETTIFCQGNIDDHAPELATLTERIENDFQTLSSVVFMCDRNGNPQHPGLPLPLFWQALFGSIDCPETFVFGAGAIFAVSAKAIRSRPKAFYERALNLHDEAPLAPWLFERVWYYMFNSDLPSLDPDPMNDKNRSKYNWELLRTSIEAPREVMDLTRAINIWHLLRQTLSSRLSGAVVELGCFNGATAVLMQRTIDMYGGTKELHLFDSFDGLPGLSALDEGASSFFKAGVFSATPDDVIRRFREQNLRIPVIHEGWFEQTLKRLPSEICFAHFDGDLYESIYTSLEAVYPRMVPGAIGVIDDFQYAELPGVARAVERFFRDKPEDVSRLPNQDVPSGWFEKIRE